MLTQERLKELLHYNPDTGIFTWIKVKKRSKVKPGDAASCPTSNGYTRVKIDGKEVTAHRLAWLYVYGFMPEMVDHINRVKTDNRILNLRESDARRNQQNRTDGMSCPGVTLSTNGKKWLPKIRRNGRLIHLGTFSDYFEAYCIRKSAELEFK